MPIHSSALSRFRRAAKLPTIASLSLLLSLQGRPYAATVDWGVSQAGSPGVYSWQHLYNWNAHLINQTPATIPNGVGDVADLNLIDLTGSETINLDGAVKLGTLNIGDISGQQGYTIAAGTGGSLTLDNGGVVSINKSGLGTDLISANMAVAAGNTLNINVDAGILSQTGVLSGAGGLTKTGDGLLMLRGTNTYTGVTTLNGGITLVANLANSSAALGSTSTGNGTVVNDGATLALGPVNAGAGGGSFADPITLNGDGFRNNGALRSFIGANTNTYSGVVTLGTAPRIQSDIAGTLTISNTINVNQDVKAGGYGFVSFAGLASGSNTVNHYGLGGFRLQGVGATQSYSGTINSTLGEIRADTGNATLANTPYADLTALNLKDSWLRIAFGNTGGAPTAGDSPNSRFSTTAPISMSASEIYIDNASFSSTSTTFFNYGVVQTLGALTLTGGHNRIGFRSANTGSILLTVGDIQKPNPGTTLELFVDNLIGTALGAGTKHRILNSAITGNVPFVGGWAYTYSATSGTNPEFVSYDFTGGNGYTALTSYNTGAPATWLSTDNVKASASQSIATSTQINSLNVVGTSAISGAAGTTLDIVSGGLISNGANTISVPFLTSSGGTLYDIAVSSHTITSDVTGAIDYVKVGGGITSFLTGNSYTGTTYINEGVFRGVIGGGEHALGAGNLIFGGSPNTLAAYENDADFTRALGTGAGEVQLLGGGGVGGGSSGFNAYGAPIKVNLGGAGAAITWGSSTFNPGILGLNVGGASTHAVTFVNPIDFAGEQRYIRVDGGGSGAERGAMVIMDGDLYNGGLVKRGGGILIFDNSKSYQNGTLIAQGSLWLRGGSAGADVSGNDIEVGPDGLLKIENPANIGSHQMIILQNNDVNTPAAITFGSGYGTGAGITFNSFTSTGGAIGTGPYNVLIANNQSGQARRIAVTISGLNDFQADLPGQIRAVAPNVEAWFGADSGNGVFTGSTLSPSGGATVAYRLGGHSNNGGVLTIANANVLTGAFPLIVGAPDATDRNYTDGTIYIPNTQSYSGQITIGQGGILWAGENGALGTGTADILLRGAELRLDTKGGAFGGFVDSEYAARNINIGGGTSTIRATTLDGGGFNTLQLGDLTFDANRTLQILSIGTNFTDVAVNNIVFNNSANTIDLTVGNDNSFQAGAGILTVNGIIADQATGAQTLRKNNGGVLVLNGANTFDGGLIVTQGRAVLSNLTAAGTGSISLTTNGSRRSDIEYRINGSGPFLFNNPVSTSGGDASSTRVIVVGPTGPGSENQVVQIPSLTINHAGGFTLGNTGSSALYFDGYNGYQTDVTGNVVLSVGIAFHTRGALTTFDGVVSGPAGSAVEKSEQGTLWLNGNNTYLGSTTISNGYLILGNDNAMGAATTDVTFRNSAFSEILASGTRTISRNFINTATGSLQTLGGLDAGAKTFSGNVNLSTRGVALSSFTGGDVTFSGVISGGFGIDKQGNGTVILSKANTYSGGTTVTQGTLIGQAQTSGSPFGAGTVSVLDADLRLSGLAAPSANSVTTVGALTVSGGARIAVNDVAADTFTTELNFASLSRSGQGTVTFVPVRGDLGGEERFTIASPPTPVNTIVGPWAVRTTSGANNAADYVTMSGTNVITATYGGTGDLDLAAGSTQVFNAGATGGSLAADRSVFAFRTDANVALNGFTLNVGDLATPANGGGIILNNGADINGSAGSKINIGNTALSLYVDDAASSSLNVPIVNTRNNANNTLATVLTKFGPGTLEIGAVQSFQGRVELNRGGIKFTVANAFAPFANLNAVTGAIVVMSPGTTVDLNNLDQEFGNLSAVNPSNDWQFSAGGLNLGTATLTVGREGSSQTFNGQILGGVGSKIVKVGGGTLTFDNVNGNRPSSLTTLEVDQGTVAAWVNDQSWATPTSVASAIPSSTTILLRGGQYSALAIGDSTSNAQRIPVGNNIIHQGGDSVFRVDRATGGGSNKLLTFGDLTLDVQRFLVNSANTYIARIDGTTTLTNHARLQTDNSFVIAGPITDNGKGYTLNKIGGSDLTIGADNSATWSGGMVITGGTVIFGTRGLDDIRSPGTTLVPTATANAGTGDIIVNEGSIMRLTAPSNVLTAQGQEVRIYGSERGSTTRVDLLKDAPVTSYNLRSLTDGSIALGLSEGTWATPINMARVGNGNWGISALSNTYYTPSTLGAGLDNFYRFNGSAGGVLSILNSGVVTGTASVVVGKDPLSAGATPAGSGASIRFYGDQNYTGNTTVYRVADAGSINGILELTGNSASPTFDVYGRLTLRGAGRVTNDAGGQVNTVNLRPGGDLRLDYSMDVADSIFNSRLNESNLGFSSTENKWNDSTPLVLDGAGINLINSSGRVNEETVGAISVRGGSGITLERNGTNGQMVLKTPSITRIGQATLSVRPTSATAELGSVNLQSVKLILTGTAPTQTNGMVAPWMINNTGRSFLSYDNDLGFINAPFVTGTVTAGGGDSYLSTFTGTEIVQFAGGWGIGSTGQTVLTSTKNVYALRVDEDTSSRDAIFDGGQINIWSGGLIAGADDTNRVNFNTTNIYFGDGTTPVEGIVYGGHSSTVTRFGANVTAANLTFDGPGQFQLAGTGNAINGTISLNGGTLYIDGTGALGGASEIVLNGNYANNFNGGQMPSLRLRHNSATTTYSGLTVTVGENVPYAQIQGERYSGTATTTSVQFQNLNILGTDGPAGTLVQMFNSNSNTDVLGTTTIGHSSPVGMNVNTATWRLVGNISSAAPIIKTGGGVLRFDGANTTFTGGFTLNAGEWRLNGSNADVGGTGDVVLNFGAVRMANNPANTTYFTNPGQKVTVNGQVTFINDRDGGSTARVRTIGNAGSPSSNIFTTSNSPYLVFQSASFGDDIVLESQLVINDSPVIRTDSADLFLRDVVSGSGTLNKAGIWYLHFDNNAPNTFSGGFNNFTGVTVVRQTLATLGTGPVQVFAGTGLSIPGTANLGATGLTKVYTSGTAMPVIGTRTIANFNAVTAAVAAALSGSGNGVLSIDANQSLSTDPLMATRNGGVFAFWNIGGGEGNGNLTANSVSPWGTGNAEFRIGGGFSQLTVNPATANSAQFAGAGNAMIVGAADAVGGYGSVILGSNANNTYGGGTIDTRARNLDGGYRGVTLSVQGGNSAGTLRTTLGTGQVDVYGDMRFEGAAGTAANAAGGLNTNTVVLHPGSRLRFDNGTAFTGTGTAGRWQDDAPIALNSSVLDMAGGNSTSAFNREVVGDLTIAGNSEVAVRRNTAAGAELVAGNVTRLGSGTLMLRHDTGLLGANTTAVTTAGSNVDRFIIANGTSLMNNNMVDPWIVDRSENQFLKYDATAGFQVITQGGAPSNYIDSAATTLNGTVLPANNGTEILNATASPATLGANLDLYALRVSSDINSSADNAFSKIIIRSGGLLQAANTPTINPDLYFGSSGLGDGEALIWANNNTLQINGKIYASQVTKSGVAFLSVRSDQPQLTGGWVINGGGVQFLTPGAAGSGPVTLNGAHMTDNDNTFQLTEVRYNFNSGTPDLFTWGGGKITVNDIGQIRSVAAADRLDQIPAIDLKTSGGGQEGVIFFQADSSRHTLRTGTVTLYDNFLISVDATSFGPGSTSGVQLGAGGGAGGLNNQGLYDVRTTGDGILSLGDNSATFTGNHTFSIGDGSVRVLSNGAFGASTVTAYARSTSSIEIATSNFVPTATLIQEPGSIERWALNDARGTGDFTFASGVNWQLFTDVSGTRTINFGGGSIMGYLPLDYDEVAVIQTIHSGVTINLTANSYLGQNYPAGTSNGANHIIYDMGKLNTTTNLDPSNVGLRGSYLVIDGSITGAFGLTKVGQDVIKLAGANTFPSLSIQGGIIQLGRDNALLPTIDLSTMGDGTSGILDLNGYNQTIGSLSGASGSINNSYFDNRTLTINQSTNTTYGGSIEGSVTLNKTGSGTLTLTGVNEYQGGTILTDGTISVAQDTSLGRVHLTTRPDSLRFNGGTLQTTASFTIPAVRGLTLDTAGGTIETTVGVTTQVDSAITGTGSLTKTGAGILQVNNPANNYSGATNITAGTLRAGATHGLSYLSRHIITGDTVSGTLDMNVFNQIIGSLASTGATQANATLALGGTLTVGADGTKDAVYAGAINGAAGTVFRVTGYGAVQTLSTVDNSAQIWNTEIARGTLNLANGAKLAAGTSAVQMGLTGVTGTTDLTVLNLQNTPAFANAISVNNVNSVGSAFITSTGANAAITGAVTLNRNIYAGAAPGTQLALTNTVDGNGTITVIDGGALRLSGANTYGAGVDATSGTPMAGGTVVRAGTVLMENNTAAGAFSITLGDQTSTIGAAVDRATFNSILGSGTFNPNGDGVTATSGGQNAGGTTGFGAFIGVSSTVDGNTYGAGDVGTRILVAGEEANPERNGIYTIVSVSGGTMNLVRADDFETGNQMVYGGQVAVTNGTYAGQTMFQYENQVVVRNEVLDPIRFRQDVVNPDLAVLQNTSGLTVANNINIYATNGTGAVTVGGSGAVTTGTGLFTGNVQLQNWRSGVAESKTLQLTSATSTGNGITLSGQINAADQVGGTADVLSIFKTGAGTVTLTHTDNNYLGTTTVADGRLQVGGGGLAGTGSLTGTGNVLVSGAATTLAGAPVLAGGSGTTVIAGAVNIGTLTNPGILAPGVGDSATSNQSMTFTNASGITVATGSQLQMSITAPTLDSGNSTVSAWLGSGQSLDDYLTANPSAVSVVNVAPSTYGDLDYINIINGTLSLGNRASATPANGALVVQDNGWLAGAAAGDLFNLFDWTSIMAGAFSLPGSSTAGGVYGDVDLPTLNGGLTWDLSALRSHGIIAVTGVVPEPSRALLLLLGLAGLAHRRRRRV